MSSRDLIEAFAKGDAAKVQSIFDGSSHSSREIQELLEMNTLRATISAMQGMDSNEIEEMVSLISIDAASKQVVSDYLKSLADIARGKLTMARARLESVHQSCPGFGAAMVGLAAVYFLDQKYDKSFDMYRKTLRVMGTERVPPVVRVGMGLCVYRLQRPHDAQKILERALEVNPDDELALIALLVVYLDLRALNKVQETVVRLRQLIPANNTVLLKVGDLMYFRALEDGRISSVRARILKILSLVRRGNSSEEMALANFQEGRLLLACGDTDAARPLLEAAIHAQPNLLAARIHLARLLLLTKRTEDAETLLKEVNRKFPDEREVLQLLAIIATSAGRHSEALRYSQMLTRSVAQGDLHSWTLAAVCARLSPQDSRRLASHAYLIQRELGTSIDWRLVADLAVLGGDVEALQGVVDSEVGAGFLNPSGKGGRSLDAAHIPLIYDLALLSEQVNPAKAEQLYLLLVKQHPTIRAPYFRLYDLARAQGRFTQAVAWMQLLCKVHPRDADAQVCLARLYMEQRQAKEALMILDRAGASQSDLPVILAAGATALQACQNSASQWGNLATKSRKYFAMALEKDSKNILAAHGLACCDGILGNCDAASSMLNRVSEVVPLSSLPVKNVDIHKANVKMWSQGYKQAMDYLEKLPSRTADQNSMLAFCYAKSGRYPAAIELANSCVSETPTRENAFAVYNVALLHYMAFADGIKRHTSLPAELGEQYIAHLDNGTKLAMRYEELRGKGSMESEAGRYLRNLREYFDRQRGRVATLVAVGVERTRELKNSEEGWRDSLQAYKEEQQRERDEQELREYQEAERRREAGRAVREAAEQTSWRLTYPNTIGNPALQAIIVNELDEEPLQEDGAGFEVPASPSAGDMYSQD